MPDLHSKLSLPSLLAVALGLVFAPSAFAAFGIAEVSAGLATPNGDFSRQAGAHADLNFRLEVNTKDNGIGGRMAEDNLRDVKLDLPPGIIGNPSIAPTCDFADLIYEGSTFTNCPIASQVGVAKITPDFSGGPVPIYNMARPGDAPALFAFNILATAITIQPRVRPGDFGISSDTPTVSNALSPLVSDITLWGVPADHAHDAERWNTGIGLGVASPAAPRPFLTNPTSCPQTPASFTASIDSWQNPGVFVTQSFDSDRDGTPFLFTGCEQLPFEPAAQVRSDSQAAATPTGLDVDLEVPQSDAPDGLATAHVKKTAVTFPEGVTVNPPSAAGQGACSEAEIAIGTNDPPSCPDSSRIGTVEIRTPLLDETLEGSLYLAEPHKNPFGSLLATYLAVKGPGFYLKLPGEVDADPETGQLSASFDDQPQLPYESVSVSLRGGPGAPLVTPARCGTYATQLEMTSWASPLPVGLSSPMTIDQGCGTGGFAPDLKAGTTNPTAGAYSPFVLRLTRADGEQNVSRLEATLPEGLLAKLAGVTSCPEAQAATAGCPAASRLGSTTVALGAGPTPLFLPEAGREPTGIYLAGPYKGAPYSLLFKVPAQAGPFDLGTVVVRAGIYVDPQTAQVTAKSDPLPQILEGIPVAYRDIGVRIDRPEFTINPTDCDQTRLTSTITSARGAVASPAPRFQVAGCDKLGFKPHLKLALKGKVSRRSHPSLHASLTARPGDANIARAQVKLPKSAFLDNAHIGDVCTRVQFAAKSCPAGSVYGYASATTPLLDYPLQGNVYLRANPAHKLPDLVVGFNGPASQPIEVELAGKTDSVKGALRNTFEAVPDVPVSKFNLTLFGGKKGLIVMSSGFCAHPEASVKFTGQNGMESDSTPKVGGKCPKAKKGNRKSGKGTGHKRPLGPFAALGL